MPKATARKSMLASQTCRYPDCREAVQEFCSTCGSGFCFGHLVIYHEEYTCRSCRRTKVRKRLKRFALVSLCLFGFGLLYFLLLNIFNLASNQVLIFIGAAILFLSFSVFILGFRYFL